ncbi:DUF3017 domain-containing protein [Streptomyces sp. NBC_01591]|uniref:DUF3017 domain-containing protein n=1 Tax=Streptomyces sp. NBC_01591 TaxID=2975888 RepID=UPI002DD987DC|nr:DUF3017 domain-containing protein [Streptomyces sp. NBC_01591]WSD70332.1 DUF3017 domain-containing protein [Streptomyces sp. NBC_01591]
MGAGTSPADPADPAAEADGTSAEQSRADAPGADESVSGEGTADEGTAGEGTAGEGTAGEAAPDQAVAATRDDTAGEAAADGPRPSRRFPSFTRDTARPEGGGRAASGDAPAPARQWPLLAVLCTAGIGLLIVALDPFDEAFRIGTMLIGVALIGGAVLRLVVPSVGMLAVRSRFTDLVTYGLLGFLIVMLALVAQPKPWLDIPFLEQAVHFTIR